MNEYQKTIIFSLKNRTKQEKLSVMGKINQGIPGRFSGRVGEYCGGVWKKDTKNIFFFIFAHLII
jgi:hypothetical protein